MDRPIYTSFAVCLFLVVMLSIAGCTLPRNVSNPKGGKEAVIQNSINDFTKTRFFKNGIAFSVSFYKDFKGSKLFKQAEGTYKWTPDKSYPDIFAVSILNHSTKFFYNPADTGKIKTNVPQCILWKDGKLFYWWDEEKPLVESTINSFRALGLIEENPNLLEFGTDDSQKAVDYFICKNDYSKYRRKITKLAIGYYKPPKLRCK
jgi:hypothetical protein